MVAPGLSAEPTEADARFALAQADARRAAAPILCRVLLLLLTPRNPPTLQRAAPRETPTAQDSPPPPRRDPAPRGDGPAPRTVRPVRATRTLWTKMQRRNRMGSARPQPRAQTETKGGRLPCCARALVTSLFSSGCASAAPTRLSASLAQGNGPFVRKKQSCLRVFLGPERGFSPVCAHARIGEHDQAPRGSGSPVL